MTRRWYGKFLGLVAGWLLLRHPAGGLLGLLVGHAFDADWFKTTRDDPYRPFGLASDASDAEIDLAYRRLISHYHPDKLAGAAPELQQQAEAKSRELNAAYDRIRQLRKQ
jgi:DnaJ-domain-containing protein 1